MALQQIQAAVHAALSLESYDPSGLMILEESVTEKLLGAFGQSLSLNFSIGL